MRTVETSGKGRTEVFESFADFIETARDGKSRMKREDRASCKVSTFQTDWTLTRNFDDAARVALDGSWNVHGAIDGILSRVESVTSQVDSRTLDVRYRVTGGVPSMGRYMSGNPRSMVNMRTRPAPKIGRVVSVVINTTTSGGIDADEMVKRGATILAFLRALHMARVGVNVWCTPFTVRSTDGRIISMMVKVADAGSRVDMETLTYAIAHPSMLRRLAFSCAEQWNGTDREAFRVGHGYGSLVAIPQWAVDATGAPNPLVLDAQMLYGIERPAEWVEKMLRKAGVLS